MKKLLIVLLSLGVALGASAQREHHGGGYHNIRPHAVIVGSPFYYSPFYPYYGFSPFGYGPYWPYNSMYDYRPTKLDLQIQDIRNDYQDKIRSARHDGALTRKERKDTIRELRHDRDQAIIDAKRNYYKTR